MSVYISLDCCCLLDPSHSHVMVLVVRGNARTMDCHPSISSGPGSLVKQHKGTILFSDADGEKLRKHFGNPELFKTVCPLISLGCHSIHKFARAVSAQLRCTIFTRIVY